MAGDLVRIGSRRAGRRVVVTFPLEPAARERLVDSLGAGIEVVDIKVSDGTEDIVVVPSTSRQLIGKVRAAYAEAVVLVVEVEDPDHGVQLGGQVMRSLEAGADAYFVAHSIAELASVIDRALTQKATQDVDAIAALEVPSDDPLSDALDALLRRQQAHAEGKGP